MQCALRPFPLRLCLIMALLLGSVPAAAPARAQSATSTATTTATTTGTATPGPCQQGTLSTGALSLICVPASGWNGDLLVWAHGYVAPTQPLGFYHLTFGGGSLPDLVQSLGYAFATTSYRKNGLAVLEGAGDIRELVRVFPSVAHHAPKHTYLTGASEGGLITTLLIEQAPQVFSGGLAACGPIGDFRKQIDYVGDFRVLFDYFFPGVLPPSPISIPQEAISGWDSVYVPKISAALTANPSAAGQLISTSKAAIDPTNPGTTTQTTTLQVLWYNVFGTNDAKAELSGNAYDNHDRWYWGSSNDVQLNVGIKRFTADPTALQSLPPYQTSGGLTRPLVTLHTTWDEVVPFWHELLYYAKVLGTGTSSRLTPIPLFRYGHCNFTAAEVLAGFGLLVEQVTGSQPAGLPQRFDRAQSLRDFARAQQDPGR